MIETMIKSGCLVVLLAVVLNSVVYGSRHRDDSNQNTNEKISQSSLNIVRSMRNSNFKVTALVDKSVTLTCSIELDEKEFLKSANYKIIWSREVENGRDYEPLALDDTRLISDSRINPTRLVINKQSNDFIQWNLVINNLKLSDSNSYICQLNQKPYDIQWLKKFTLNVYEPASFIDDIQTNESNPLVEYENSIFVKSINEMDDFKLRCNSKGRPRPTVTWFLRYINGTLIQLHIDSNEIVIKSIKKSSKIDRVECQISNGYGATVTRSFKINIKHRPYMQTKPKTYRVPVRTNEIKLNCSLSGNPLPQIQWYFLPNELVKQKLADKNRAKPHNSTTNRFGLDDIEINSAWKSLNSVASYSFRHMITSGSEESFSSNDAKKNSSYSIVKLPLTKYQIFEKRNVNHVISTLEIKLINEKDFGLYRCFASNELGNHSVDFKIQELNYESVNNEKMRSLLSKDKEKSTESLSSSSVDENYTGNEEEDDEDDLRESNYYLDKNSTINLLQFYRYDLLVFSIFLHLFKFLK